MKLYPFWILDSNVLHHCGQGILDSNVLHRCGQGARVPPTRITHLHHPSNLLLHPQRHKMPHLHPLASYRLSCPQPQGPTSQPPLKHLNPHQATPHQAMPSHPGPHRMHSPQPPRPLLPQEQPPLHSLQPTTPGRGVLGWWRRGVRQPLGQPGVNQAEGQQSPWEAWRGGQTLVPRGQAGPPVSPSGVQGRWGEWRWRQGEGRKQWEDWVAWGLGWGAGVHTLGLPLLVTCQLWLLRQRGRLQLGCLQLRL